MQRGGGAQRGAPHLRCRAWQILPATTRTRISDPRFMRQVASYDVASSIYQALL